MTYQTEGSYIGYGVVVDHIKWHDDRYDKLFQMIEKSNGDLWEEVKDFFQANPGDYESISASFFDFCEYYCDDLTLLSGWEPVLTSFINEQAVPAGSSTSFVFEDNCFHVPLYIARDETEKCLTMKDVQKIIDVYIQPFTNDVLRPSYHEIYTI